ncbi:MAG: DUF6261 family protein [Bradymonadaceae bacterium]
MGETKQDPLRREGAKSHDDQIDRALSQLADTAERFAEMEVDTDTSRLAGELSDDLFPNGVYHVTSKSFDDQHIAVDELLNRLTNSYTQHVEALNLSPLVERLRELNEEFGNKLAPQTDQVDYDEVESATVEAEDAFHLLVARIMADYGDDMETFNRILQPLHEQTERTRRHFNRRGSIPEVDPETGEPVEPDGQTDNNPQNDGGENTNTDGETDNQSDTDTENDGNTDSENNPDGESNTDNTDGQN